MNVEATDHRELIERCYRYALGLTHDEQNAQDLVQDAWVAVIGKEKPTSTPYMLRVIRNRYIDQCRRRGLGIESAEVDADGSLASQVVNGEWEDTCAAVMDLERALSELRFEEQEVLYMNAVEGMTAAEISEQTGRPRGTVLSQIHRARRKLHGALGWAALALICLSAVLIWRVIVRPSPEERAAEEIATSHGNAEPVELAAAIGYDGFERELTELDFVVTAPDHPATDGLTLEGARYCSVQGERAAQITLRDRDGNRYTLFEVDAAEFQRLDLPAEIEVDGVRVVMWEADGVMFGLAGP